jgi:hypothetical protein
VNKVRQHRVDLAVIGQGQRLKARRRVGPEQEMSKVFNKLSDAWDSYWRAKDTSSLSRSMNKPKQRKMKAVFSLTTTH